MRQENFLEVNNFFFNNPVTKRIIAMIDKLFHLF